MGEKDDMLWANFPGSYMTPLGDADGQPVEDWGELLNAGYRLERNYVREMIHVIDGQRIFDPKMPVDHDAGTFAKSEQMTSKMLGDLIDSKHVEEQQLKELSLLSGKEHQRRQRLLISELPETVLLPKVRDLLQVCCMQFSLVHACILDGHCAGVIGKATI